MPDAAAVIRSRMPAADPADVVTSARSAGLPLPVQSAKLEGESRGANVFGNDRVAYPTRGLYTADTVVVTLAAVQAYLTWSAQGPGRQNGVGPSQLTYRPFQLRAEELGGLHVPRVNMRVGADEFARCLRAGGGDLAEAARRYNGGDGWRKLPPTARRFAEQYGERFVARVAEWERALAGATVSAAGSNLPVLSAGMTGPQLAPLLGGLQRWANVMHKAYAGIPVLDPPVFGPRTLAWCREYQRRSELTPDGVIGPATWAALLGDGFRP